MVKCNTCRRSFDELPTGTCQRCTAAARKPDPRKLPIFGDPLCESCQDYWDREERHYQEEKEATYGA